MIDHRFFASLRSLFGFRVLASSALGLLMFTQALLAQEVATPAPEEPPAQVVEVPDPKSIEEKIQSLEQSENLDPVLKDELNVIYTKILNRIQKGQDEKNKADQYRKDLEEIPVKTENIRQMLAQSPQPATPSIASASTLTQIEQILGQREAKLAAVRGRITEIDAEINGLPEARKAQSEQLIAVSEKLNTLRGEKGSDITEEMDPRLQEAKRIHWQAKEAAHFFEIQALEKQAPLFDVRNPFLTLSRDLAVREVADLEVEVETYRRKVTELRNLEAERAAARARMEARAILQAATSDPAFQELAQSIATENARLAELRTGDKGPLKGIEQANQKIKDIEAMYRQVSEDFARMKSRVEVVGLVDSIGPLLRKYRAELPNFRQHYRNVAAGGDKISQIEIEKIDLREQRLDLANVDAVIKKDLSRLPTSATEAVRVQQEQLLRELRQTQRKYLEDLQGDFSAYFDKLTEWNSKEAELARVTEDFADFINQNVLWIPSGNALRPTTLTESFHGMVWFLGASRWMAVLKTFGRDFAYNSPLNALVWALFAFFLIVRPRILQRVEDLGSRAEKKSTARFNYTVRCLFHTSLLSVAIPGVLFLIGWRFSSTSFVDPQEPDFVRACGFGLEVTSLVLLILNAFKYTLIYRGLAISHFDWPENPILQIRKSLWWLIWVVLPPTFVIATLQWYLTENYQETFGRLLFVLVLIATLAFGHQCLHLKGGPFQEILDFKRLSGRNRFRYLWYGLGVGIPAVILILAFMGYYYTSLRLAVRFFYTLAFVLVTTIVYGLILRWLFLARRRLAMDQARKRRDLARAKDPDAPRPEVEIEEEELDLVKIDFQTRQLIRSLIGFIFVIGLWYTWAEELPALSKLNQVVIKDMTQTEVVTEADGTSVTRTTGEVITLTHLMLAFLIGLMTLAATKNLPALLEIAFFQRFQLAAGERYALTTIVRYVILAGGIVLVFHAIGIGWANLQWLVAAVGLGLGFGLQEIFANFVSGLIILFERPIRVGDTVTISGVNGTVSRINIRATTITDFDRKELIVPNKEFVTGQLINWTLTDPVLRVVVPVGIAYGSDTALAHQKLLEVAANEPLILEEPRPQAVFLNFGASTLDFELRGHVRSIDDLLAARHSLHMAIDRSFREAGIEIAFPQQDLHVRSLPDSIVKQIGEWKPTSSPGNS